MKVFVVNQHQTPLMPTTPRKARLLLKHNKAKIYKRDPFTIQLIHGSSGYIQRTIFGIDAGYSHFGFSVVNNKEELIGGKLKLLEGISQRLTERRNYRRTRRNRLRHQKPLFHSGLKMICHTAKWQTSSKDAYTKAESLS